MATSLIFGCFTLASLLSSDRKFLYLGGTLMSGLSMLMFLGLLNIFFRSHLVFEVKFCRMGACLSNSYGRTQEHLCVFRLSCIWAC